MAYISIDEAIAINEKLVKIFGGSSGVRDLVLLQSALARPQATFGEMDLYPDIFTKATALIQSIILNHPFLDGNKRTAITCCTRFLNRNGYVFKLPVEDTVDFVIDISSKSISFEEIIDWIKTNSSKSITQ